MASSAAKARTPPRDQAAVGDADDRAKRRAVGIEEVDSEQWLKATLAAYNDKLKACGKPTVTMAELKEIFSMHPDAAYMFINGRARDAAYGLEIAFYPVGVRPGCKANITMGQFGVLTQEADFARNSRNGTPRGYQMSGLHIKPGTTTEEVESDILRRVARTAGRPVTKEQLGLKVSGHRVMVDPESWELSVVLFLTDFVVYSTADDMPTAPTYEGCPLYLVMSTMEAAAFDTAQRRTEIRVPSALRQACLPVVELVLMACFGRGGSDMCRYGQFHLGASQTPTKRQYRVGGVMLQRPDVSGGIVYIYAASNSYAIKLWDKGELTAPMWDFSYTGRDGQRYRLCEVGENVCFNISSGAAVGKLPVDTKVAYFQFTNGEQVMRALAGLDYRVTQAELQRLELKGLGISYNILQCIAEAISELTGIAIDAEYLLAAVQNRRDEKLQPSVYVPLPGSVVDYLFKQENPFLLLSSLNDAEVGWEPPSRVPKQLRQRLQGQGATTGEPQPATAHEVAEQRKAHNKAAAERRERRQERQREREASGRQQPQQQQGMPAGMPTGMPGFPPMFGYGMMPQPMQGGMPPFMPGFGSMPYGYGMMPFPQQQEGAGGAKEEGEITSSGKAGGSWQRAGRGGRSK